MNRQAIAFLTMFSLVLMLAVYYVTMPIESNPSDISAPVTSNMQLIEKEENWNSLREALLDKYSLIIANVDSSSQDKQMAMENISSLRQSIDEEKKFKKIIVDLGYENCHVEIEKELMRILVMKENANASDATKIIKTILVASDYRYVPEVSFQELK